MQLLPVVIVLPCCISLLERHPIVSHTHGLLCDYCQLLCSAEYADVIPPICCELWSVRSCGAQLRFAIAKCPKKTHWIRIGSRCSANCANISTCEGRAISWVCEVRYLGIFIICSRHLKCTLDNAKRSFYSAVNGILGKLLNIASEYVILQLIASKCMPVLLYGLKACSFTKTALRSLEFTVNRTEWTIGTWYS